MEDVLLLLRLEHGNQARLLNLLERQIDRVQQGHPIEFEVVQGITDYFLGYPDLCHHPKENAVFRKLCARDPAAADAVGDLLLEHEELTALTERLAGVVRKFTLEGFAQGDRFTDVAERFVDTLRRHMQSEEEVFFPAVQRCLTADDWAEIDFQVFDQADPLFSETVERRFEALRDHIHEANAGRQES